MSEETALPPVVLLINSDRPPPIKDVLRGISKRPGSDCQLACDYLDSIAPGTLMDMITRLIQDGRSGPFVYRHCAKAFKKNADPRFAELIALAIEWSVRNVNKQFNTKRN